MQTQDLELLTVLAKHRGELMQESWKQKRQQKSSEITGVQEQKDTPRNASHSQDKILDMALFPYILL